MAVGDQHVFPGFLTPVLTHLQSFQSHRLLFLHPSAEVRGENKPERKVASTGDRTRNHQVLSPTRLSLCHPGGAFNGQQCHEEKILEGKDDNIFNNKEIIVDKGVLKGQGTLLDS